ncbi:type 1 glutamine amidotransferase [Halomonas sp. Bachu 37]|uniref:type 1 glutamine amidotransferase n=1 Tax=Halomonas kashgarensis TaxID=3084920 RepID=UPI0032171AB4
MHVHLLQHSPHQNPARITDWLTSMGHSHTVFHLHAGELVPRPGDCDALILLDAPEALATAPPPDWLKAERKVVSRWLDSHKPMLGIGFGAQLIADALGAVVARGTYAELGWHEVTLAPESPFDLPERFQAFMWHRWIFSLPEDAIPLGGSEASPIQGFSWDCGRVMALLCHLEINETGIKSLLAHAELPEGSEKSPYVQARETLLSSPKRSDQLAPLLDRLLSQWLRS